MNSACKQIETNIADFVEGHADTKTRASVQAHLETCSRCRRLVGEQKAMRQQLRLLAQRDKALTPPVHLWERAALAWDARDARRHQKAQVRWAFAGACMMVFLMSAVWARLTANNEFPVEAVLRDFRAVRVTLPTPAYVTEDPDKAAHWLRARLNADVPPVNLSLSRAELWGADVVSTPDRPIGRLLYRTSRGVIAVYLAPGGTHFAQTTLQPIENQTFQVKSGVADVGMYGWDTNAVGYGLALAQPIGSGRALAINAAHASEETEQ